MKLKDIPTMTGNSIIDGLLFAIKVLVAFVIAQWAALAVGPKAALTTLVFFMGIDWITGLTAAWINGEISSEIGRRGLTKKGLTLLLILTVHIAERICGYELNLELFGGVLYSMNELISIIENMDRAGVDIPKPLVDALIKVKGLGFGARASRKDLNVLRDSTRREADHLRDATRAEADANQIAARREADANEPTGPTT